MKSFKLFILGLTLLGFLSSCETLDEPKEEDSAVVYSPIILIDTLPDKVVETSGLIFYRGSLWTINDNGGKPEIYRLDIISGDIVQVIALLDVENVDFEDITQDDNSIYVGDFGNNFGNRKDLSIYKIAKTEIPDTENVSIKPERIQFNYADQISFLMRPRLHNFDGEALISFGDHLYIFSKNWADGKTRVYKVPKGAGEYTIDFLAEFPVDGLITAAEYNEENGMLSLLGYKDFVPFVWIFWEFEGNNFFDGKMRRINLESIHGAQTEGICYNDKGDILISCELSYFPQRLYQIPSQALKSDSLYLNEDNLNILDLVSSYSENEDLIQLEIRGLEKGVYAVEILNEVWKSEKKLSFTAAKENEEIIELDARNLPAGMYYLRVEQKEKPKVSRIYLNK